ncbi:hypothetical protein [Paraburkholderia adhaesiva]|uniref:hypothetical protein n=1 Tax=Paraburkholderia adhaesiva TaxID=2883244 RepID=UPI001F3683C4|nr:hypothetical protein [Paraburkholderia adhaesiva]
MKRPMRRKPHTAAQLMPLRRSVVEHLSLQQHCALAAFRDGRGSLDQISILMRAIYLPFLMSRAGHRRKADPAPYRAAEAMLYRCLVRGQTGQEWRLEAGEAVHFAALVVRYDTKLQACRTHVYDEAVLALMRAEWAKRSPLANRDAPPEDSAFFALLVERTPCRVPHAT